MCETYGLNSMVVYYNAKTCDIWEGNMITRSEIWIENIHSLKVLGYERRSDIKKVGNAEFKVYNSGMMGAQSKFESSCVDYLASHYYMLRAYKWVLIVEYVMEGSNN